jgi:hypothetical protein
MSTRASARHVPRITSASYTAAPGRSELLRDKLMRAGRNDIETIGAFGRTMHDQIA